MLKTPLKAQNLLPDSSFEAVTQHFCGIMSTEFDSVFIHWNGINSDQFSCQVSTSCYNHCTNPSPQGPIPPKGSQAPRTGDVYAGLFLYTIPGLEQREYVQTRFSAPMVIGQEYQITAWVSLADFSEFSSPNFDFLLGTRPNFTPSGTPSGFPPLTAHSAPLQSTTEWMMIRDTVTADSAYEYLTLGNFRNDAATQLASNPGSGGGPGQYGAYYFVDDVSVRPLSEPMSITEKIAEPGAEMPGIFRPEIDLALRPRLPAGGMLKSISFYNLSGRKVAQVFGNEASWNGSGAANGLYLWMVEWDDSMGQPRADRGKILLRR